MCLPQLAVPVPMLSVKIGMISGEQLRTGSTAGPKTLSPWRSTLTG